MIFVEVLVALVFASAVKLTAAQQKISSIVFPTEVTILSVWFYSLKEMCKTMCQTKL